MSAARFITDFADQAVLLPIALLVGLLLAISGWRRGALVWVATVLGAFAAALLLKLIFSACGHMVGDGSFRSPSGHVAAAAAVYGGLTALAARRSAHRTGITVFASVGIAVVIGASRLILRAHTLPEIAAGAGLGIGAALAFARWAGWPPPPLRFSRLVLAVAASATLLHGLHLPAEAAIRHGARRLWPLSICAIGAPDGEQSRFRENPSR